MHGSLQLSSAPSPNLAVWRVGDTCWGAGSGRAHPGLSPLCPRPPCPARVPPPRLPPAEQCERTATRGAHRGRSAQLGTPSWEPSGSRGHPRGGRSRGKAVETPGAAGRARLVSAAAGCREPESERRDPVVPCPPSPVSVPGFAPAALYPLASSVLVLCVSESVFPSVSLTPSIYCFTLSLSNLSLLSPAALVFPVLSQPVSPIISVSVSVFGLPVTQVFDIYLLLLSLFPSLSLYPVFLSISSLPISVSPFLSLPDISVSLHLDPSRSFSPHLCLSLSLCPISISVFISPCHCLCQILSRSPPSLCFLVLVTLFDLLSLYLSSVNTHFCLSGSVSLAFSTFLSISGKAIFLPFSLWPPCPSLNP